MVRLVAEIGLNYAYGDSVYDFVVNAKKLIDCACVAGFDYVKFQKREPEKCVPKSQWKSVKEVPWRESPTTYLQYKKDIEFNEEYHEVVQYCKSKGIGVFVSVWDCGSVDFWDSLCQDEDISTIMKIPSAKITDLELCRYARGKCQLLQVSTGMSTETEIQRCVRSCDPDVIYHTNSSYPTPVGELNLGYIKHLHRCYPDKAIGYSGHEFGLDTTIATVMYGVKWIERHITLSHDLWGSDQKASIEPVGMFKLVKGVRELESAIGGDCFREVYDSEVAKKKILRG